MLNNIQELKTCDEIDTILEHGFNEDNSELLPPLLHGTNVSILECPEDEREKLQNACKTVIKTMIGAYRAGIDVLRDEEFDKLLKLLRYYVDNKQRDKAIYYNDIVRREVSLQPLVKCSDFYGDALDAYNMACANESGFGSYEYGSFYVTCGLDRAISYSKISSIFGERGWVANRLVGGAKAFGLVLPDDDEFVMAWEQLLKRKEKEDDPCILMIVDAASASLLSDRGDEPDMEIVNKIKMLNSLAHVSSSFRLDLERIGDKAQIYMIKQENYSELEDAVETAYIDKMMR